MASETTVKDGGPAFPRLTGGHVEEPRGSGHINIAAEQRGGHVAARLLRGEGDDCCARTLNKGQTSAIGSPHIFPKSEEWWKTEFFQKHAGDALQRHQDYTKWEFLRRLYSNGWRCRISITAALPGGAQHAVEVEGRGYRLDFVFEPRKFGALESLIGPQCPKIALELDGHDFHERTKEQVTYRNRRDRDLQADGWIVLHVSGSEFNANPEKVVKEVWDRVTSLFYTAHHAQHRTA